MSMISDQGKQNIKDHGGLLNLIAPALILFLIYFILSALEIWAFLPSFIQIATFCLTLVLAVVSLIAPLRKQFEISSKKMRTCLTLFSGTALALTMFKFTDMPRITTLAIMPDTLFDHQQPEVTVNITSPIYLKKGSKFQNVSMDSEEGLGPVHEGSTLDVRVNGLKWRPYLQLSDGTRADFIIGEKGVFSASVEIKQSTSWAIKQGAYEIGMWPLEIIDDQSPEIHQFSLDDKFNNDKNYLALNVDVEDDHKIMRAKLNVVSSDGREERGRLLSLREVKTYSGVFYVDLMDAADAGSIADLKLSLEDEAGQVSTAIIENVAIPAKDYRNPLAGKLIALYESLEDNPGSSRSLERQIQALGLLSDKEMLPPVYYLVLRSAYWRLANPTNSEDRKIARDLLWDLAQKMEDGELRTTEHDLVQALEELTLLITQERSVTRVRNLLGQIDGLFRSYRQLARLTTSDRYSLEIDLGALRKLYSHILAYTDQKKFTNAAQIVNVMRKGLVQNDDLILSKDGLGNYFALSEGRQILDNLISIQRTLLANSHNDQLRGTLIEGSGVSMPPSKKTEEDKNNEIMLQSRVGQAVKKLGERLTFVDRYSVMLIDDAASLVDDILNSMKQSEIEEVTKSQTELLTVMSNLKRLLDKPISGASELETIIEAINAQPVS